MFLAPPINLSLLQIRMRSVGVLKNTLTFDGTRKSISQSFSTESNFWVRRSLPTAQNLEQIIFAASPHNCTKYNVVSKCSLIHCLQSAQIAEIVLSSSKHVNVMFLLQSYWNKWLFGLYNSWLYKCISTSLLLLDFKTRMRIQVLEMLSHESTRNSKLT